MPISPGDSLVLYSFLAITGSSAALVGLIMLIASIGENRRPDLLPKGLVLLISGIAIGFIGFGYLFGFFDLG